MEQYTNFYVFTGSRGGQKKFAIGNIDIVKKTLKKAGISLVDDITKADAVIVPDGAISNYGLPIFTWNDFIQFRRKNKITQPTKTIVKDTSQSEIITKDQFQINKKDPIFNFNILEESLKNMIKEPYNNNTIHIDVNNPKLQENKLYTYTTKNTIDIGFGIKCMQKIVDVTEFFLEPISYIFDLYSAMRVFYQQLDQLFKIVLKFWGELRGNLSLQYDLPPIYEIKKFNQDKIEEVWYHFKYIFNPLAIEELSQFFTIPLSVSSMTYFEEMEQDIIYMQYSIVYKNERINEDFEIWSNNTRTRFRRCELLSESNCSHCCIFKNGKCKDKPFLVALDDIIKSLCGSKNIDYFDDLQFLQTSLIEIFVNLFGVNPLAKDSICSQIIYMFDTIKLSLESMIGKSIRWSQVSNFMKVSEKTWNNLWLGTNEEKQESLIIISEMKEDPLFVQATKKLIIALSQIEI